MKKYIYSQKDLKAEFYNVPMIVDQEPNDFAVNIARSIKLCHDPVKVEVIKDCNLYYLGHFDDETGLFTILDVPEMILDCKALISKVYENN